MQGGQNQQGDTAAQSSRECKGGSADVVFVLDSSGSIGQAQFTKQLQFVSNVAGRWQLRSAGGTTGYQVSVVTYSDDAKEEIPLNKHTRTDELQKDISSIKYIGSNTMTHKALNFAKDETFKSEHGGRYGAVKIVIVMTDGQSSQPQDTVTMAKALHGNDVMVLAVGIGTQIDPEELKTIASDEKNVFTVESFDLLDTIEQALEERTCTVTYEQGGGGSTSATAKFDMRDYFKWCAEQQLMKKDTEFMRKLLNSMKEEMELQKMKEQLRSGSVTNTSEKTKKKKCH